MSRSVICGLANLPESIELRESYCVHVCVCVQVLCVRSSSHGDCYAQSDHSGAIMPEQLGRALDRLLLHDGMHHMNLLQIYLILVILVNFNCQIKV